VRGPRAVRADAGGRGVVYSARVQSAPDQRATHPGLQGVLEVG
jgi:hypothetical protein